MARIKRDVLERFMSNVTVMENGCWLWGKSNRDNGYVDFVVEGKKIRAHIWAYLNFKGEYNRKLDLDHTCHNNSGCSGGRTCEHRRCVNPDHLEPITRKENANRGEGGHYLSKRTHCTNGHLYTDKTRLRKDGVRRCSECRKIEHQKRKLKWLK